MVCEVGSISHVHPRLQAGGFLVSGYALRRWIKSGELPAVFAGCKALTSFNNVLILLGGCLSRDLIDQARSNSGLAS